MQFELVRKRMKMKTDGPTLDEMSNLDTTGNLEQDTTYREPVRRPVSTKKRVKNWFEDYTKEIIISIVSARSFRKNQTRLIPKLSLLSNELILNLKSLETYKRKLEKKVDSSNISAFSAISA